MDNAYIRIVRLFARWKTAKENLYGRYLNVFCRQLLNRLISSYEFKGTVEVVIDRFLYGGAQEKFNNFLADGLIRSINIIHLDSKQCPCLQAVDFIAGAVAHKYRDNDDLYYNKIKHKITMSMPFEPG